MAQWRDARALLDEIWFVAIDEDSRVRWLIERHVRYGKAPDAARVWVLGTDQRNAELVQATKARADALVQLGP